MLGRPADPPDAREQIEADGSFDHVSEAWFLKLDSTIEEVENRTEGGGTIKFPLKLLDRIFEVATDNLYSRQTELRFLACWLQQLRSFKLILRGCTIVQPQVDFTQQEAFWQLSRHEFQVGL